MRQALDLADARRAMVDQQLRRRGISDERVLRAMADVRREAFVAADLATRAYNDEALPIDAGQTISQPYMVAAMLEAAAIRPEDRVLEVGTGSGYVAALLGRIAGEVYTIERRRTLYESARRRLAGMGHPALVKLGDGGEGWPAAAPFDVILVAAASSDLKPALKSQLSVGGRLVAPIGDRWTQRLMKLTRDADGEEREEVLAAVSFVPLLPGEAD